MKSPISTIILAYNEEKNIRDCLESIYDWSDEIIVVDSGSRDKTLDIARDYTDNIYEHSFENYARQRNWAQQNLPIKNEWVFHLDADERVGPGLASEIKRAFSSRIDADGFMMPRKTIFKGRWIRHGGHYPAYHLRIFKKDKGNCEERLYDQHFTINGKAMKLKGDIINIIESDINLLKDKHRCWAHLEAQQVLTQYACSSKQAWRRKKFLTKAENTRYGNSPIQKRKWLKHNLYYKMPLFVRPVLYFLYRYIIRLGFLDGREGFIFHFWQGLWFRWLVDCEVFSLRGERDQR